jgi:hypothetical protein
MKKIGFRAEKGIAMKGRKEPIREREREGRSVGNVSRIQSENGGKESSVYTYRAKESEAQLLFVVGQRVLLPSTSTPNLNFTSPLEEAAE